ncbi:multiubiquitin domain-containing protein [Sulfurovum mangrovi]|uniref:multiubiquitin domain-containing protein n=1 Tax=Sulfurovum mangrovi TaxID=2893889 RepID=UPI001E5AC38C|nr:multiubiquitin domain-containing protein [Sulfurovum mangrovi]UFH58343.1 multiubiquitin domain-containing protein [Sulfurovum mangrovi]
MQNVKKSYIALYVAEGNDTPYSWNLEVNGTTIFSSTAYVTEEGVRNSIEQVKQISHDHSKYIIVDNTFELHDDGFLLGKSISYNSGEALDNAIHEFNALMKSSSIIAGSDNGEEEHRSFSIFISGEEYEWNKKTISFEEAIITFFGTYDNRPAVSYTVGYKYKKTDGQYTSMTEGEVIDVKNKMRFEIDKTDRS